MPARMASYPESVISFWPRRRGGYALGGGPWPIDDGERATYLRKLARALLAAADEAEERAAAAYDASTDNTVISDDLESE